MDGARTYETEIVIAGGGLAGMVAAHELLGRGRRVLLIDKDRRENFGGLAKESFGGVHMIGTPHQRRLGINDSPELAWRDWLSVADYDTADDWPRAWGRFYCENSREYIFEFLDRKRITFLPLVNWPERGLYAPGNSVPRWHIVWGTGYEIVHRLLNALSPTHSARIWNCSSIPKSPRLKRPAGAPPASSAAKWMTAATSRSPPSMWSSHPAECAAAISVSCARIGTSRGEIRPRNF